VECGPTVIRFCTVIWAFPAPAGRFWERDQMVAYPIENMGENTMFWVPIKVALEGPIGYKKSLKKSLDSPGF
jgi:hypothetical protein